MPVLWTLQDVTFDDGGAASGSFVFDAETSTFSLIDITTTGGSTLVDGATYAQQHPFYLGSGPLFLVMVETVPVSLGTRALQLPFLSPLSDLGGTVVLGGLFNFGEGICGGDPCQDVSGDLPFRRIASGESWGRRAQMLSFPSHPA